MSSRAGRMHGVSLSRDYPPSNLDAGILPVPRRGGRAAEGAPLLREYG